MYVPDDGVTPVIAVAVLIGMVAIAGFLIGLAMFFAALGNASGTLPDVRFQASADGKSLYHAGGDALPLESLVFYDREMMPVPDFTLIKGGSTDAASPEEQDVWETGDRIHFDELEGLSIVGLDSRGNPALLWRGVNAMMLPVGDMVPDVWEEIPGGEGKSQHLLKTHNDIIIYSTWEDLLEQLRKPELWYLGLENYRVIYDAKNEEYWFAAHSVGITKEEAEMDISTENFASSHPEFFKINFHDIRTIQDIVIEKNWETVWKDGRNPYIRGTLYEYTDGKLYVMINMDIEKKGGKGICPFTS